MKVIVILENQDPKEYQIGNEFKELVLDTLEDIVKDQMYPDFVE